MVGMIEPTALESSTALSNVLLQSGGSGGSLSWQFLLLIGIGATVVLALAWILWGTTE